MYVIEKADSEANCFEFPRMFFKKSLFFIEILKASKENLKGVRLGTPQALRDSTLQIVSSGHLKMGGGGGPFSMSVGHTQPVQSETAPLATSPRTPRPAQDTGGWSGTTGTGVCMCVCVRVCAEPGSGRALRCINRTFSGRRTINL